MGGWPLDLSGLTTVGFPNLFMITGPGSPSVLSNMMVSIEQHVDWVADCVDQLRAGGFDTIEPTPAAESGWDRHVQDCGNITLYPTANSRQMSNTYRRHSTHCLSVSVNTLEMLWIEKATSLSPPAAILPSASITTRPKAAGSTRASSGM